MGLYPGNASGRKVRKSLNDKAVHPGRLSTGTISKAALVEDGCYGRKTERTLMPSADWTSGLDLD